MRNGHVGARGFGTFDARAWIAEGDGLRSSAEAMRELWRARKVAFDAALTAPAGRAGPVIARDWSAITGMPRASVLLLAYTIEMYLKAGVVKAFAGCSEASLDKCLRTFGHQYEDIAKEIELPLNAVDAEHFEALGRMVTTGARYPVAVVAGAAPGYGDRAALENARTFPIWSEDNFAEWLDLAARLRAHAQQIDRDPACTAHFGSQQIASNGWIAWRRGGHLSPRITWKPSSEQRAAGQTGRAELHAMMAREVELFLLPLHDWPRARVFLIDKKDARKDLTE